MPTRFAVLAALLLGLAACQTAGTATDDAAINDENADLATRGQ